MATPEAPDRHGGEVYALARRLHTGVEGILDFSSNANIFAEPLTAALVRETPYPFLHYPDTQARGLAEAIARHEGVGTDRVLPGNGSAELIWLLLRGLAPGKALFLGPVFSEYIFACQALGIPYEIVTPPVENDFICGSKERTRLWNSDADLVIMCTPNNPAAVTYPYIRELVGAVRSPRLVIDNCYREFLFGGEDYEKNHILAYAEAARPGVSVFTLNSFTKFFCCPGIRLGYLLGDRIVLERLAALRPSWTISPFAQSMGEKFFARIDAYRETLAPLAAAVTHMGRELRRLDCVDPERVFEGPGFLCCGLSKKHDAGNIKKDLQRHCILIRNCDTVPGMPRGFIRVQARKEEDTHRLFAALAVL